MRTITLGESEKYRNKSYRQTFKEKCNSETPLINPDNRTIYVTTPSDHMSACDEYSPSRTCGDIVYLIYVVFDN